MTRRVVVTGIGAVTPLGNKEQLWQSVLNGISGIGKITLFDASNYPVQIGGSEVSIPPTIWTAKMRATGSFVNLL